MNNFNTKCFTCDDYIKIPHNLINNINKSSHTYCACKNTSLSFYFRNDIFHPLDIIFIYNGFKFKYIFGNSNEMQLLHIYYLDKDITNLNYTISSNLIKTFMIPENKFTKDNIIKLSNCIIL